MVFRNTNKIQQQGLQIQARSLPYLEKQNTISHRLQQGEQPGNEERGKVKFRINYIREKNKKDKPDTLERGITNITTRI